MARNTLDERETQQPEESEPGHVDAKTIASTSRMPFGRDKQSNPLCSVCEGIGGT